MSVEATIDRAVDELMGSRSVGVGNGHACRGADCPTCHLVKVVPLVAAVVNGADRLGLGPQVITSRGDLAPLIDHTLLKPEATPEDITILCHEAARHGFATVCVNPCFVKLCAKRLAGATVGICTVVGFPLGATTTVSKAAETHVAVEEGAEEIDVVIPVGMLKAGEYGYVRDDIGAVVDQARRTRGVKVIIETCLLTDEEKVKACLIARDAGARFVKTSTGFGKEGATLGDVALMRKVVGEDVGVKAAGGIRDYEKAQQMIQSGASRVGASASVSIVGK